MPTTYTPNAKIPEPQVGDTGWGPPVIASAAVLDALNAVGDLCVTLHETPSTTLAVAVAAGQYVAQDGTIATYAGTASQAITLSSTKVLYLDLTASGALVVGASYPTTAHVRLATVVAGSASITSITDNRQCYQVVGSMLDGVNFTFGTTTGTQIGTATSQKLGFFGKTPIVQPTVGATAPGATYTSVEQGILTAVLNAIRNLGLGS
jgi:hypothetical protein